MDAFTRVDAQLAFRFRMGESRGRVALVAQNLGSDYPEFNINNRFETRLYLTAQLELPE